MRRILLVVVVCALGASAPRPVAAFCGFYVAGAEDDIYNNATMVALMRSGTGGATPGGSDDAGLGAIGRGQGMSMPRMSTFQGRHIIRHEWAGVLECENPRRGIRGGPPPRVDGSTAPKVARDLAFAVRGSIALTSMLAQPVPPDIAVDRGEPVAEDSDDKNKPTKAEPPETEKKGGGGCGCRTGGSSGGGLWLAVWMAWAWRRRRG